VSFAQFSFDCKRDFSISLPTNHSWLSSCLI
jgi:hypothetical protein